MADKPTTHENPVVSAKDISEERWREVIRWLKKHRKLRGKWKAAKKEFSEIALRTMQRRYKDGNSSRTAYQKPVLTKEVEELLVEWIRECAEMGACVPDVVLRDRARKLAAQMGNRKFKASRGWSKRFLDRHFDNITTGKGELVDLHRLKAVTRPAVQWYFKLLELCLEGVAPEDIGIMDEVGVEVKDVTTKVSRGIGDGVGVYLSTEPIALISATTYPFHTTPMQVYAPKGRTKKYLPTVPATGHVTLVACVTAAGKTLAPTVIFKGERPNGELGKGWPEANLMFTDRGYQDEGTFRTWCELYVKAVGADAEEERRPRVLLVDNHGSHLVPDAIAYLKSFNIRVVTLHPHTTHVLCALDTSVFGGFKKKFAHHAALIRGDNRLVTKYNIVEIIRQAWEECTAIKEDSTTGVRTSSAIAGFRDTGVCPFNPNVLTPEHFDPFEKYCALEDERKKQPRGTAMEEEKKKFALSAEEIEKLRQDILKPINPFEKDLARPDRPNAHKLRAQILTYTTWLEARNTIAENKAVEAIAKEKRMTERDDKRKEREAAAAEKALAKEEAEWEKHFLATEKEIMDDGPTEIEILALEVQRYVEGDAAVNPAPKKKMRMERAANYGADDLYPPRMNFRRDGKNGRA